MASVICKNRHTHTHTPTDVPNTQIHEKRDMKGWTCKRAEERKKEWIRKRKVVWMGVLIQRKVRNSALRATPDAICLLNVLLFTLLVVWRRAFVCERAKGKEPLVVGTRRPLTHLNIQTKTCAEWVCTCTGDKTAYLATAAVLCARAWVCTECVWVARDVPVIAVRWDKDLDEKPEVPVCWVYFAGLIVRLMLWLWCAMCARRKWRAGAPQHPLHNNRLVCACVALAFLHSH